MMEKLANEREKHFSIFIWKMVHQYTMISIAYIWEWKCVYEKEKHVHWNVSLDDIVGFANIPNEEFQILQNVWSAKFFIRIRYNVVFFHFLS